MRLRLALYTAMDEEPAILTVVEKEYERSPPFTVMADHGDGLVFSLFMDSATWKS